MRNRLDTVMIFCAGRGTRMGELTRAQPKPLVQVAGKPLIAHALSQLEGIERRFANLHYLPEELDRFLSSAGIVTIFEPALLETGGGLKNALHHFDREAVYTMNSDAVWIGPSAAEHLARRWNPEIMDALLLTVPVTNAHGHKGEGDFIRAPDQRLTRGAGEVYTGLQIIKTNVVAEIGETEFSLNLVWERLLARKKLFGVSYKGEWCDVGYPEAIALAESVLER